MKLSRSIKRSVDKAFDALSSVTKIATYVQVGSNTYSPTTGTNTQTAKNIAVEGIFSIDEKDTQSEGKGMYKISFLVRTSKFNYTLSVNDTFIIDDVKYNVEEWGTDPSDSLYDIQLSKG